MLLMKTRHLRCLPAHGPKGGRGPLRNFLRWPSVRLVYRHWATNTGSLNLKPPGLLTLRHRQIQAAVNMIGKTAFATCSKAASPQADAETKSGLEAEHRRHRRHRAAVVCRTLLLLELGKQR